MANRAQNASKGRLQKDTIVVIAGGELWFGDYSTTAKLASADTNGLVLAGGVKVSNKAKALLTGNSTGLIVAGGVKISNKQMLTANSTGLVFADYASSLPGNVDNGVLFGLISNSTGACAFINTTGTTHKYLNVTTKQPT